MTNRPNIFPAIRYQNAPALIDWLCTALGFDRHFVVPGEDGMIAHAQMKLGAGIVMLGSAENQHTPESPWDKVAFGIYVRIDDVDAHHAHAKAAGADIVTEPQDTDYGSREYSVRDPEGRLWSFGTYDPYAGH